MGVQAVLYVEDDDAAFTLVNIILREQAPLIQLSRARDGMEALAILRTVESTDSKLLPDLILLDLNLPKKNGLEVLTELKASKTLREIPVVMFSTSAAESDINNALEGGAREYITKPSSFDSFVEAVKSATSFKGSATAS